MKFRVKKQQQQQQQQQTEVPLFARAQQLASTEAELGSVNEVAVQSISAEMENDVSKPSYTEGATRHQSNESKGSSSERDPPLPSSSPADSPPPPPPPPSSSASTFPRPQLHHSASAPSIVSLQGFLTYIAERGRRYADRQRWRLVLKDGTCNVSSTHVTERKRKYLVDLFTTVLDMKWRFNALMFSMAFVISWTLFAFVWWLIALGNGDLDDLGSICDDNHTCCVANVYNFWTALLFSIESQHTIGYGYRVVEPNCVSAAVVLMVQSCVGVFIQCFITGVVFSKLSRPKSRAQTIMFSRQAVICRREGRHCLLFRVGDMRKSHLIGTSIRAMVVRDRVTSEGECIPLCQSSLKVETEMGGPGDTFAFLVWPVTVTHVIDEESPLWEISAEQLITEHFEIIVILEGTVESNGKMMQIRTSYLPSEILWGHRLTPLLTYQTAKGTYDVDHKQFNGTVPIAMTERSAKAESALEDEADGGRGGQLQQQRKPFYQNLEKDSSISLVRHQAIGQPIELSNPKRLYKRFRSTTGNSDTQRSPTFTIS